MCRDGPPGPSYKTLCVARSPDGPFVLMLSKSRGLFCVGFTVACCLRLLWSRCLPRLLLLGPCFCLAWFCGCSVFAVSWSPLGVRALCLVSVASLLRFVSRLLGVRGLLITSCHLSVCSLCFVVGQKSGTFLCGFHGRLVFAVACFDVVQKSGTFLCGFHGRLVLKKVSTPFSI